MSEPVRRVAVTGAAGYIGAGLVRRLEGDPQIESILATDIRPPGQRLGPKVTFIQHDIALPLGRELSDHGIEAVAHLAYVTRPGHGRDAAYRVNVDGTANVLAACRDARVQHVLYLSSTSVYGAHRDNPPMLTEDSPTRPLLGFQYSEDKLEAESLVQDFALSSPDVVATILRACPVLGPNADDSIARAFLKPVLVAFRGQDPPMQLVHEEDLTDVLVLCIQSRAPGLYNVAGDGEIRWSQMARTLGRRLVRLPAALLYGGTGLAWTLRLQSDSPPGGLDFIRYGWTASTEKIKRELGVSFHYSSQDAWEAFAMRHRGRKAPARCEQLEP